MEKNKEKMLNELRQLRDKLQRETKHIDEDKTNINEDIKKEIEKAMYIMSQQIDIIIKSSERFSENI